MALYGCAHLLFDGSLYGELRAGAFIPDIDETSLSDRLYRARFSWKEALKAAAVEDLNCHDSFGDLGAFPERERLQWLLKCCTIQAERPNLQRYTCFTPVIEPWSRENPRGHFGALILSEPDPQYGRGLSLWEAGRRDPGICRLWGRILCPRGNDRIGPRVIQWVIEKLRSMEGNDFNRLVEEDIKPLEDRWREEVAKADRADPDSWGDGDDLIPIWFDNFMSSSEFKDALEDKKAGLLKVFDEVTRSPLRELVGKEMGNDVPGHGRTGPIQDEYWLVFYKHQIIDLRNELLSLYQLAFDNGWHIIRSHGSGIELNRYLPGNSEGYRDGELECLDRIVDDPEYLIAEARIENLDTYTWELGLPSSYTGHTTRAKFAPAPSAPPPSPPKAP